MIETNFRFSASFLKAIEESGEKAFIEKNRWVGYMVPQIIRDDIAKRGAKPEDFLDAVVLSPNAAKWLLKAAESEYLRLINSNAHSSLIEIAEATAMSLDRQLRRICEKEAKSMDKKTA